MTAAVTLEPYEVTIAAEVGRHRRGSENSNGFSYGGSNIDNDIQGALAECAFAKLRNRYWDMSYDVGKRPDFPPNIYIKSTHYPNGHLLVRPSDPNDAICVLMIGEDESWTGSGLARCVGRQAP